MTATRGNSMVQELPLLGYSAVVFLHKFATCAAQRQGRHDHHLGQQHGAESECSGTLSQVIPQATSPMFAHFWKKDALHHVLAAAARMCCHTESELFGQQSEAIWDGHSQPEHTTNVAHKSATAAM